MGNLLEESKLEFGCKPKIIKKFLEKLFNILKSYNTHTENLNFRIELASREMLANAIEHGCSLAASNGKKFDNLSIKTIVKIGEEKLIYSVQDPGPGFDWENYDLKTMPKFEEKGRGLKMINKVTEKMEFNQKGNKITVTFKV